MYKVRKVLNNNAILVIDLVNNQEVIFIGTGVGFGKKINMITDIDGSGCQRYIQEKGVDISNQLSKNDAIYLEIASKIIEEAKKKFGTFDTNILIALSDHIAFAIARMNAGLQIDNPFKNDIKLMFTEEYEVAKKSVDIIYNSLNVVINEDEISYITLHLHSARCDAKISDSLLFATLVRESMEEIENSLNIQIDYDSLSYSRLLTHLKYLLLRCNLKERLTIDMDEFTKTNFPISYGLAKKIIRKFERQLNLIIDDSEIGYLAIHLERICTSQD